MAKTRFYQSNKRAFKAEKFICLIDGKPGTFDGDQICFASSRGTSKNPVEVLTKKEAEAAIKATIKFREDFGLTEFPSRYSVMPVYF